MRCSGWQWRRSESEWAWRLCGWSAATAVVPAAADDVGPIMPAAPAASPVDGYAPFEMPAGTEYRLADSGVERYKASLAPLWTWEGDVGTYGDGATKIRVVTEGGQVGGIEILTNASGISDTCLEAQMMYGLAVNAASVAAACDGMWTQEWAQRQADALNQGG